MTTWPIAPFPQTPLVDGYDETAIDIKDSKAVDKGPDIERVKGGVGHKIVTWPMLLTSDQVTTFKAFYNDDLNQGDLDFIHNEPVNNDRGKFKILNRPEYAPVGNKYKTILQMQFIVTSSSRRGSGSSFSGASGTASLTLSFQAIEMDSFTDAEATMSLLQSVVSTAASTSGASGTMTIT